MRVVAKTTIKSYTIEGIEANDMELLRRALVELRNDNQARIQLSNNLSENMTRQKVADRADYLLISLSDASADYK